MSTHLHDFTIKVMFIFLTSVDIQRLCKPGIDFKATEFSMHHEHYLREAIKKAMNTLIIPISSAKHKSEIPFMSAQLLFCCFFFNTPDFTPSVKGQQEDH